jgi:hypothetical protein
MRRIDYCYDLSTKKLKGAIHPGVKTEWMAGTDAEGI